MPRRGVEQMKTVGVGAKMDALSLLRNAGFRGEPDDHLLAVIEPADDVILVAESLDHGDHGTDRSVGIEDHVLGPDTGDHRGDTAAANRILLSWCEGNGAAGRVDQLSIANMPTRPVSSFSGFA